jgi:hypothetical protein
MTLPTCFNTKCTYHPQAMAENGCHDCEHFNQCAWSDGMQSLLEDLYKENLELKMKLKILPKRV